MGPISLGQTHRNAESRGPGYEQERSHTAVLNQGGQVCQQVGKDRSWRRSQLEPAA